MGHYIRLLAILIVANFQCSGPVLAQDWPARSVTMVVPGAAGSGSDIMGRVLASRLEELLGHPIVVNNVGGAGGMIGASYVAKATPDGYQFLLGNVGTHAVNQTLYKKPLYNAATDFTPVLLVAEVPMLLVVRKDLPVSNLQEFIAYAKLNHVKMQFGSSGVGSASHLTCVLLNTTIGVNITHIPYRGSGPAMQDLVAGQIDYQCAVASVAVPQIQGDAIKALAILTKDRSPTLPNLASAHEQGLPDFNAVTWIAIFLPKYTPAAIVQKLHDATVATMNTQAFQQRMRQIGADIVAPDRRSPEYLQKFVTSEIEKWAAPIKASGVSMH